ncbi:MAG: hypothetical protein F7B06_00485 [Opitutae bacterium]|nr:hypothetical protein [Opitutae bacterium]
MRVRNHRGSIIIFVMVMVALLSLLLASFTEHIMPHIRMYAMKGAERELRRVAYSTLEVSLAVLAAYGEYDQALYAPTQGWGDPLALAGISFPEVDSVKVEFVDETGKLPLSSLYGDDILFRAILETLGYDDYTASELVDKLQDWVDEDDLERANGAENDYYWDMPIPYEPPNQPIYSMNELALIGGFNEQFFELDGRPNELFLFMKSLFSPVNDSEVNINTADATLFSLGEEGMTHEQRPFWEYLAGDDGVRGTADDRYFENTSEVPPTIQAALPGIRISHRIRWLNIYVTVKSGLNVFELRALVSVGGEIPRNQNTAYDRFQREEPVFAVEDASERTNQISSLQYPLVVVEVFENEIAL